MLLQLVARAPPGRACGRVVAVAAFLMAPLFATAQDYPKRPVRIIVPFAAGGPADVCARFVGQHLQEVLGQSFIVDNRPGAGSIIGTDAVAKSAPDGYTLLLMSNTHTVNESLAMAGVSMVHIPYRGSSGARTDVLGGQVDLMFDAIPTMADHIRSGKVKAYSAAAASRAADPALAARFVALLTNQESRVLRIAGGFDLE